MNEIENSVQICINIMENISKSSLKNNIIEIQSQLKDQQNIFDINNNKQNIKQTEIYIG